MTDIGVDDLSALFESLAREAMKDHERRFQDRIRSVRDACNALDDAASRFERSVRNAWGTMDKSASEYGTRMAQTIEESARKLSRQEASASYGDAERFHSDSVQALNTIIKAVRRYVPKLGRGLRVEIGALNVTLSKVEAAIRSLGLALDESPGNKIDVIRKDILHLTQTRMELQKLKTEEAEMSKFMESNAAKEREALTEAKDFSSQDTLLELDSYEESLRAKEDEIGQFLQPIIKPLTKLEREESIGKNQTVDLATLRSLVDRPVETVATGQPFALIQLLTQLHESLGSGRLQIEDRRRRKAEETIAQAKEGAIEKLREDYLTIQANVQETLRQLKAAGLLDKKEEIERRQALIRDEKEQLTNENADVHRRIDTLARSLTRQKISLEQQIQQVTSKNLEIRID